LCGGKGYEEGGRIVAYGKDSEHKGLTYIEAHDGTNMTKLNVRADGRANVNGKNIVRSVNNTEADNAGNVVIPLNFLPLSGGTLTGAIVKSGGLTVIKRDSDGGCAQIVGGTEETTNAHLNLYGKNHVTEHLRGTFTLAASNETKTSRLIGAPDGTLTWDGSQALLPAGAVFAFAANETPNGCLICNGAAVSRTTYARLFAAIGTTYGSGNGSTTFNLPNLTDRFIQGSGTAGTVKAAGLPNITGTHSGARYDTHTGAFATKTGGKDVESGDDWKQGYILHFDASKSNAIYGKSTTVQPPALTMRYYIKY
jgi:microcystin-dependent protein